MAFTPASSLGGGGGLATDVNVLNFPGDQLVHFPTPVDVTVDNASLAVTGPLTDAQLRASPVPVQASISGTVPISAAALPLPAGAATEATAERAADTLDDVGLTAILEREKLDA